MDEDSTPEEPAPSAFSSYINGLGSGLSSWLGGRKDAQEPASGNNRTRAGPGANARLSPQVQQKSLTPNFDARRGSPNKATVGVDDEEDDEDAMVAQLKAAHLNQALERSGQRLNTTPKLSGVPAAVAADPVISPSQAFIDKGEDVDLADPENDVEYVGSDGLDVDESSPILTEGRHRAAMNYRERVQIGESQSSRSKVDAILKQTTMAPVGIYGGAAAVRALDTRASSSSGAKVEGEDVDAEEGEVEAAPKLVERNMDMMDAFSRDFMNANKARSNSKDNGVKIGGFANMNEDMFSPDRSNSNTATSRTVEEQRDRIDD